MEKNAAVLRADADLAKADILLQEAKVKNPPTVAKDLDALSKKLATAKTKLEKAQASQSDLKVATPSSHEIILLFDLKFSKKVSSSPRYF